MKVERVEWRCAVRCTAHSECLWPRRPYTDARAAMATLAVHRCACRVGGVERETAEPVPRASPVPVRHHVGRREGTGPRWEHLGQRRRRPPAPGGSSRFSRQQFSSTQTWVRLKIFLIRINLVSVSFDSTQLMTHKGFTGIDSNQLMTRNGFLKIDSNQLTTPKAQ